MPDDTTESVATLPTHSLRLNPSIICMPQLQPCCSGTQIYDPEVSDEGSDQPKDTIEPHDLVYYGTSDSSKSNKVYVHEELNMLAILFSYCMNFFIFTDLYPAVLLAAWSKSVNTHVDHHASQVGCMISNHSLELAWVFTE